MSEKITEFKEKKKYEEDVYAVPYTIKQKELEIKCPLKEQFNVDHYRVLMDGDYVQGNIYLELGYDDNPEYDSGFFIPINDALKLAKSIIDITQSTLSNYNMVQEGKIVIDHIKTLFKYDEMKSIRIIPKYAYRDDPMDTMFGSIVMEVYYTDIDDNEYHAVLLSEVYKYKDLMKYDTLVRDLVSKNNHLKEAEFDVKSFKSIIKYLKGINDSFIKNHEELTGNVSPDKQAKIELDQIAKHVIDKINENKGDNN